MSPNSLGIFPADFLDYHSNSTYYFGLLLEKVVKLWTCSPYLRSLKAPLGGWTRSAIQMGLPGLFCFCCADGRPEILGSFMTSPVTLCAVTSLKLRSSDLTHIVFLWFCYSFCGYSDFSLWTICHLLTISWFNDNSQMFYHGLFL